MTFAVGGPVRIAILGVVGVLLAASCSSASAAILTASPDEPLTGASGPILGVLEVGGTHFAAEKAAGVRLVTVDIGWRNAEPTQGTLDRAELAKVDTEIRSATAAGFAVVLDPGIQYPPDWVFDLPGGTRFVNQYGDVFTGDGGSGKRVANAVTNEAVRLALGRYLSMLGGQLSPDKLLAIRQGGGPTGELRYPDAEYNGHTNCWWAYDSSTQESSPVPGWKPGTGTTEEAAQFLTTYNSNLVDFGVWLNAQFRGDFAITSLVMLPGWGERPGFLESIVNSRLTKSKDEWNQGLDWTNLLRLLPDRTSVAYTTYLDAPSFESNQPETEDPAHFVAQLAAPEHLRIGGENTGNNSAEELHLSLQRAVALRFVMVNWMSEGQLVASSSGTRTDGPTFKDLGREAKRVLSPEVKVPKS